MTPNKAKKPLPSSTSVVVSEPEEPQTSREWRFALQRVKSLYFRNQWKQCVARCNGLLERTGPPYTLYAAFLHFYAALSNEAIARVTHNLSTTKIPLLEQAKKNFQAASRIMPALEDPLNERQDQQHNTDTNSEKSPSSSVSSSSNSTPRPSPPGSPLYPSSASSTGSISDTPLEPHHHAKPLKPSPSIVSNLSLSGYSSTTTSTITPNTKRRLRPSPLRITPCTTCVFPPNQPTTPPAQIIPSDLTSINRPLSVTFSASSHIWVQNRSLERYHTHLIAFANMLIAHIEVVEGLMQSTEEAQANRYTMRRLMSSGGLGALDRGDEEEEAKAERKARIARLKARGWRRERFAPERYQELCARALGEL